MTENWFELAIIVFIIAGIGMTVWKGGQANPEGTGSLSKKLGSLDKDFRAMRGEVRSVERRVGDIERNSAKADDIVRLERMIGEMSRQIANQTERQAEMAEIVAAIRADGDQRGKQLDRLYDFIVQRGMSK